MPRIPDQEIDNLKRATDLQCAARSYGLDLKRHGNDLVATCPWHDDKTPSLVFSQKGNHWLWHCMGACNEGGDIISFVMKMENITFLQAVKKLKKTSFPGRSVSVRNAGQANPSPAPAPIFDVFDHQRPLKTLVRHYQQSLPGTDHALAYLDKRGLNHKTALKTFRIGFGDHTFSKERLGSFATKEGKAERDLYKAAGVITAKGTEHFRGYITFPIVNNGKVLNIYGRNLYDDKGNKQRGCPHKYLPGPQRGTFNLDKLEGDTVILCESIIDALTFWIHGFKNVTTAYGINGFTDEMLDALKARGTRKIYIAFDGDKQGEGAAVALSVRFAQAGLTAYRVPLPPESDVNGFACKADNPKDALRKRLTDAIKIADPSRHAQPLADTVDALEPIDVIPVSDRLVQRDPGEAIPFTGTVKGDLEFTFGSRAYRVRGLDRNKSFDTLKVTLRVSFEEFFHLDTVDLVSDKQRAHFVHRAEAETSLKGDVLKRDLGKLLLKLEDLQEAMLKESDEEQQKEIVELTPQQREDAMLLLRDPNLMDRILADYDAAGIVGEESNKLVGYLAATSRKLKNPLAIIVQSSSAAGKSSLMDAVLALMPPEQLIKYSAVTGQSLFYQGETDIKHKILAIVEEEGAEKASYALKLLQSEGELTISSTGKDPQTGKHVAHPYKVEGPVMIFLTTTSVDMDEELMNRCLVLTVNETREQTRRIHERQRDLQTLDGLLLKKEKERIETLHQNAQRLLNTLHVVNPLARQLTFLDHTTRTRRDHMKYLNLINAIALLHQYQRPIKSTEHDGQMVEYIEATDADIDLATKLMRPLLQRSLDELPPQTRRLLELITEMVTAVCKDNECEQSDYFFSRRELRDVTNWGDTQLKVHLCRLVDMEYLVIHKADQGRYEYELLASSCPKTPNNLERV